MELEKEEKGSAKLLHERAILVRVVTHSMGNTRTENAVSQEVAQIHGGDAQQMGKYVKNLFAPSALAPITTAKNQIISFVSRITASPWGRDGWHMLPIKSFGEYREGVATLLTSYESAVNRFVENYEKHVEQAKQILGNLFDPLEYPSSEEIRNRFYLEPKLMPIPHEDVFAKLCTEITEEEITELKKKVLDENRGELEAGMKYVWQRLYDYIKRISDKLNAPNRVNKHGETMPAIFHKTMLENLQELCPMLTRMNITNDPKLEELRQELQSSILCQSTAEKLREDFIEREEARKKADELLGKIGHILSDK